ncbi:MAG TPA: hypothetical protein VGF60_13100 [Xanthobacteraceae bacterium]
MIHGLRTYTVSLAARQPLLNFIVESLKLARCRILYCSEAGKAPFIITFETAGGERLGIVAYAFRATRTPTRNRPADERSFQVKYGNKTDNKPHRLWIDPLGLFTTLFVGISAENDEPYFVSADPAMHNPTRFFIRIEFKDRHIAEVRKNGWCAWERERRSGGEPIEVLVGGTPERFLDLVRFERAAQGLDPGNRQLLAERPQLFGAVTGAAYRDITEEALVHPLASEFDLSNAEILDLIAGARRLKMAVRGWVAEEHLRNVLAITPGVTHCEKLDVEGGPDLSVQYRNGPPLLIECKNVLRKRDRDGRPRLDFQRTRASKADPCSRYYSPADFDVIAACLHAVTEQWEFRYTLPSTLAGHDKCKGKLASNVVVESSWATDPTAIFRAAYAGVH